jgi:hypothetical protein
MHCFYEPRPHSGVHLVYLGLLLGIVGLAHVECCASDCLIHQFTISNLYLYAEIVSTFWKKSFILYICYFDIGLIQRGNSL